jgi:hypothetical protein
MQSVLKISPVMRAVGVIAAVAVLVTGITFAALQSQATLTNNTIASATADLQVDNTDSTTSGFGSTDVGYAFTGVVPGGADSNVGNFQLKNNGTANMSVAVQVPTLPTWTVNPAGPVVAADVDVIIACVGSVSGTFGVTTDLAAINTAPVALTAGNLNAGDTTACTVKISMDATAFSGSSASSTNFDFVFTGTGV